MDSVGFSTLDESILTYKTRKYVQSSYVDKRCLKSSLIIGSIITLITIVIALVLHLADNNTSTESKSNESMQLVLSGNNKIFYFDVKNKTVYNQAATSFDDMDIGLFEVHGINNFFWFSARKSIIYRIKPLSNSSDGFYNIVFQEPTVKVQDMAYDHIGENLYVIDKSARILIVINMQTRHYNLLLTDLIRPHHIQVDPQQGFMFILQQTDSIFKGNMDGTSLTKIVKSDDITAMTVDTQTQRVYWADESKGIESSDYEGENRHIYRMDTFNIVDMAVVNTKMYWLWEEHVNELPNHRLVSCEIINGICGDLSINDLTYLGEFGSIKATQITSKGDLVIKNPCSKERNRCQHFCLLSSNGESSCVCKLGWQLDLDKKSCRETKEIMIYTFDNYFRGRILDVGRNISVDTILPTPYKINANTEISFDYDLVNDNIYFSDNKNIYTMKLRSNRLGQSIVMQGDEDKDIKNIVYDWITGNLYYMEAENEIGYMVKVLNIDLGNQYNKTLIKNKEMIANSMAIHPTLGYLIHSAILNHINQNEYKLIPLRSVVHIATTNGTALKQIPDIEFVLRGVKSMSIDYSEKRIYWLNQKYRGEIRNANFNGTDIKTIILNVPDIRSISVHRRWIYAATYRAIYRFDKKNTTKMIKLAPILNDSPSPVNVISKSEMSVLKIFSESFVLSKDSKRHPCSQRNGGCDQYCFLYNEKRLCDCRDGEILSSQGHCIENPKEN